MTEAEFKTKMESYWLKAAKIVRESPDLDIGDVFHALRCLDLPPMERLARGLMRDPAKRNIRSGIRASRDAE